MKNLILSIVGVFTRNWGLKLLALALAIVIYYSLKPMDGSRTKDSHDRTLFHSR